LPSLPLPSFCSKAIALDANNVKAYIRGGKAELSLGNIEGAIALLTRGLGRGEEDSAVKQERTAAQNAFKRLASAREAMSSGEHDKALTLLNMLVDTCPGSSSIRLMRVEALLSLNRFDEAVDATSEMLKSAGGSTDAKLLYLRARVLHYQGNSASAIKHLQEALRVDPDDAVSAKLLRLIKKTEALKAQGNDAFKASKWQDAIQAYTDALELDQRNKSLNAKLYCNRAAALLKQNKPGEAVADCNTCLELDEKYVKGYIRRAQAGMALGDVENLEMAVRDYNKARELTPDSERESIRDLDKSIKEAQAALKKAKRKDYYKILEVEKDCTEEELKKA
jgi:DnaJ family protein C protein 7